MTDKVYWIDVAERAAKTAAQAAAGVLAGSTVLDMDWRGALAIVGTAVLGSLLTSLASLPVGEAGSASAVHVPKVSHDQVIDTIERAARSVQSQTVAGINEQLIELLKSVNQTASQTRSGNSHSQRIGKLPIGWNPQPAAAVDAQTGEDDDTTPTDRPATSTDSWGRP